MTTKVLGLMATMLLLAAAPAGAQAPTSDAYGGAAGVLGQVAGGSGTEAPAPTGGSGELADDDVPGETTAVKGETAVKGKTAAGPAGGDAGAGERGGVAGERLEGVAGTTFAADTATGADALPFTGLDVGLLAAGSLLLIALGLGLRRLGRPGAAV